MQNKSQDDRQMEALLDFLNGSGVDQFVGEHPVDWFELTKRHAQQRALNQTQDARRTPPAASGPVPPEAITSPHVAPVSGSSAPGTSAPTPAALGNAAVVPDERMVADARQLAASAQSLEQLRAFLEAFDGCNLKLTAKTLVFADGNPASRLMFVGEAPGRDEDHQGKPFVGRSGQLLDKMLSAIGMDRSSAYIANVVPWRPPGNRTPTPQETEICKPFIVRQIELVNPDVLVFLGAASAKTLLGAKDGIRKMRGRWMTYPGNDKKIAALATYHPAYLLRSPLEKRLSWRDFLSIQSKLSGS